MNAEQPATSDAAAQAPEDASVAPGPTTPAPDSPWWRRLSARRLLAPSSRVGLAVGLMMCLGISAVVAALTQCTARLQQHEEPAASRTADKPTAASAEPRQLDMTTAAAGAAAHTAIPALQPEAGELDDPIPVRAAPAGPRQSTPEDAPVMLVAARPRGAEGPAREAAPASPRQGGLDAVSEAPDPLAATSRQLAVYQRQLQGLLEELSRSAGLAGGEAGDSGNAGMAPGASALAAAPGGPPAGPGTPVATGAAGSGLFGGQLVASATPRVRAAMLGDRSLTLPKGTAFTCALKTRVVSAASGLVGCQVQRHVYGDDGRVLLIERGSHLDGEYRIVSLRPGSVRIPVLWTRIRTPLGVTVDIDSPATGSLGESGIDGYLDNRWGERLGAAMLLSLIDDSVKLVIQNQAPDRQADTVVLPSTTANTSRLAEKVLDSTINIPPLVYRNQGGIVGIYVARDVDFSGVYELRPGP